MKTEVTSWTDQYTGVKCFALRVYELGYLQWQSEPCASEEAARNQIKFYNGIAN